MLLCLHIEICTWIITEDVKTKICFSALIALISLNSNQRDSALKISILDSKVFYSFMEIEERVISKYLLVYTNLSVNFVFEFCIFPFNSILRQGRREVCAGESFLTKEKQQNKSFNLSYQYLIISISPLASVFLSLPEFFVPMADMLRKSGI